MTRPCSPAERAVKWSVTARNGINVMVRLIAMMAAMKIYLCVMTASGQNLPCARTAASVLKLSGFVTMTLIVTTALTSLTLGQTAHIAKRRTACLAQVFLEIVQSFAMEMLLAQMLGTNYSLPASQKLIL